MRIIGIRIDELLIIQIENCESLIFRYLVENRNRLLAVFQIWSADIDQTGPLLLEEIEQLVDIHFIELIPACSDPPIGRHICSSSRNHSRRIRSTGSRTKHCDHSSCSRNPLIRLTRELEHMNNPVPGMFHGKADSFMISRCSILCCKAEQKFCIGRLSNIAMLKSILITADLHILVHQPEGYPYERIEPVKNYRQPEEKLEQRISISDMTVLMKKDTFFFLLIKSRRQINYRFQNSMEKRRRNSRILHHILLTCRRKFPDESNLGKDGIA